jgi:Domain of unknown function (DUF397)
MDIRQVNWRKSSKSNTEGNQCVEVAVLDTHQEQIG